MNVGVNRHHLALGGLILGSAICGHFSRLPLTVERTDASVNFDDPAWVGLYEMKDGRLQFEWGRGVWECPSPLVNNDGESGILFHDACAPKAEAEMISARFIGAKEQ